MFLDLVGKQFELFILLVVLGAHGNLMRLLLYLLMGLPNGLRGLPKLALIPLLITSGLLLEHHQILLQSNHLPALLLDKCLQLLDRHVLLPDPALDIDQLEVDVDVGEVLRGVQGFEEVGEAVVH